jgi:hypothetical protein
MGKVNQPRESGLKPGPELGCTSRTEVLKRYRMTKKWRAIAVESYREDRSLPTPIGRLPLTALDGPSTLLISSS